MAKIYLIRHAESIANTQGVYQGQSYDTELSPLGEKQAAALGSRFKNIKLDAVYTSPLKRTFQTAMLIDTPQAEISLMETNHGDWEGKSKFDIEKLWPQAYSQWLTNPETLEFPNGEKFTDTANRVITWFSNVLAMEGVYAVVTHTNIIQIILAYIKKTGLNSIWSYTSQPTGVTLVESHSPARIIYHNDTSHLDGLKSDLSTHAL